MDPELDLHPPYFTRIALPLCRLIAGLALFFLGPLSVRGKYRVPRSGGLLILSNHQSDCDPVVVQVSCPRPVYFMAKSELFAMSVIGPFLRWFRAFPVKRGAPDREAIRKAVGYLRAGHAVCVFPEGELSETGELLPLKAGVALIARMSGATTICLGISGTNRVLPYGSLLPRPAFRTIRACWGEPRRFPQDVAAEEFLGWVEGQLRELTGKTID